MDVILDMVGAPYWGQNVACLARRGRLIIVSGMGGRKVEVDLGALQGKLAQVIGSAAPLPFAEKIALTAFPPALAPLRRRRS